MTEYERLVDTVHNDGIEVVEFDFTSDRIHGLYTDGCVAINKNMTNDEKLVTLYEEWGHSKVNSGNLLNQKCLNNRKQETAARRWAYEKFMPVEKFIALIIEHRPADTWELLEIMHVPYPYLCDLIDYYQKRYGPYKEFNNDGINGCIWFQPIDIAIYK